MSATERLAELRAARRTPASRRLVVGAGGCGRARGAGTVLTVLQQEIAARELEAEVVAGGCNGMCYDHVQVDVRATGGPRQTFTAVSAATVPELVEAVFADRAGDLPDGFVWDEQPYQGLPSFRSVPFLAGQTRLLTRDLGTIDPAEIDDYLDGGGYATLARALDAMTPDEVVAEVRTAGLIGRGGAYFPTAVKWAGARAAPGEPRWLVVNLEEGEPGVFKDRHLVEGDPHRLIEGLLLAAYAVGASRGIIFVNGEAHLALRRLSQALAQARTRGLVGDRVLGTPFGFRVEIRSGSGGYILGEETALLEAIEGARAMPRVRPPFPVEHGLWGKPTVINNAETIGTLRSLLELGGAEFARIGLPSGSGTKLIGLSGNVARPGLVEIAFGTTMRALVEAIGGGVADGRRLMAVLIGGPSGLFVQPALLDEPIQPRGAVPPGTGGWVVLDDQQSMLDVVRALTRFNLRESCGKCTPCREGTIRLVDLLDQIADGRGGAAELHRVRELCAVVAGASLCGLGQMAPNPILSALQHFESELLPGGAGSDRAGG